LVHEVVMTGTYVTLQVLSSDLSTRSIQCRLYNESCGK
jgi:hypothetical protein